MKRISNEQLDPKNVLVFEDSLNGAKSGIAAGCQVVMIPQRQFLDENGLNELNLIKPHLADMLNSLDDFDPVKFGLAAFEK